MVRSTEQGFDRVTLIGLWSIVGMLLVGGVLVLVWHSRSQHEQRVAAANQRVAHAAATANAWILHGSAGDGANIEALLSDALASENATETAIGEAALLNVRNRRRDLDEKARAQDAERQARELLKTAMQELDSQRLSEAVALLKKYLADPHAIDKKKAQALLKESETAISDQYTYDALVLMSDADFERAKIFGTLDDGRVSHPALLLVRKTTVQRNLDKAALRREEIRIEEEKKREVDRLAASRLAEEQRQREERMTLADLRKAAQQRQEDAAARAAARKQRELDGKVAFDYAKAEYARRRIGDKMEKWAFSSDADREATVVNLVGTLEAAITFSKLADLYLRDKFESKEIQQVFAEPMLDPRKLSPALQKTEIRLPIGATRFDFCAKFVEEYGAWECPNTRLSAKWMIDEARIRMAEE